MRKFLKCRLIPALVLYAGIVAAHFPYGTDPLDAPPPKLEQEFYDTAFLASKQGETDYERIARQTAEQYQVKQKVSDFAAAYGLKDKRVLEVGAGSGSLQDIVDDYTGLDLTATTRRHFHKPFVQASATAMPFRHDEFDACGQFGSSSTFQTPRGHDRNAPCCQRRRLHLLHACMGMHMVAPEGVRGSIPISHSPASWPRYPSRCGDRTSIGLCTNCP